MTSPLLQPQASASDSVQPDDAMQQLGDGAVMVDVCLHSEFAALHIPGAIHLPVDRLSADEIRTRLRLPLETPLLIVCPSGTRARLAMGRFTEAGFHHIHVLAGGTSAWLAAGLPVERGKACVSLERQVRIAAGSLVALGCLLAAWVHPAFIILAAAVGCGLVFAGITDTCAMGMALARMPWNHASSIPTTSGSACQVNSLARGS